MSQKIKKNKAAQQLSRLRWENLSAEERRASTVNAIEAMRLANKGRKRVMSAGGSASLKKTE